MARRSGRCSPVLVAGAGAVAVTNVLDSTGRSNGGSMAGWQVPGGSLLIGRHGEMETELELELQLELQQGAIASVTTGLSKRKGRGMGRRMGCSGMECTEEEINSGTRRRPLNAFISNFNSYYSYLTIASISLCLGLAFCSWLLFPQCRGCFSARHDPSLATKW